MKTDEKITGATEVVDATEAVAKPVKEKAPKEKAQVKAVKKSKDVPVKTKKTVGPKAEKSKKIPKKAKATRTADNFNRNFNRYKVNGEVLPKGRAVLAAITTFVEKKKPTLQQLKTAFPDELIPNYSLISEIGKARKYNINGKTRFFVKKEDILITKDGKQVVICNQITEENLKPIIKQAKAQGVTIAPVK